MKKSYYHIVIILFLAFSILAAGCATSSKNKKTQSQIDLSRAKDFQKAGRYDLALEHYQMIKNKYPLSPEAVEAELEIAETFYLQGSYLEALSYFQTFRDLHPRHKKSDFALFRVAMCHYLDIPASIDRDLSSANKAIEAFEEFISVYPKSNFTKEARQKRRESLTKLAEKQFYIAEFYFKRKRYLSALGRFQVILKEYRKLGLDEKVLYHVGLCYYHTDKKKLAKKTLRKFVHRYPNSKFKNEANNIINKI